MSIKTTAMSFAAALCIFASVASATQFPQSQDLKDESNCSDEENVEAAKLVLFEINRSGIVPAERVGDSVFRYRPEELVCDPEADEEEPCLATVDHWQTVCFQGKLEDVCPAFKKLFLDSRDLLMNEGAEEDVELLSCSSESGITVLDFNLLSFHGGPHVVVKGKMIPMCPIFVK